MNKKTFFHKTKHYKNSFTAKYNCDKLVYYRYFPTMLEAIAYEKKLKAGSRAKKIKLINEMNPEWKDLYDELSQEGSASLRSQ
ncbi:MAG: GIY-YIG nuclease family protein [Flavobacteriaceae bacterium]|nr:GIY-YIG nuclease family protein [Flavobacteriaceae bacterium]